MARFAHPAECHEAATGEVPDLVAEQAPGDFFRQAQSLIDRSLERGIIRAEEAGNFREIFERIRIGLGEEEPRS